MHAAFLAVRHLCRGYRNSLPKLYQCPPQCGFQQAHSLRSSGSISANFYLLISLWYGILFAKQR